jgi:hypothetical protein
MNFIDKVSIVYTITIIIQYIRDVDFWYYNDIYRSVSIL